MSARLLLCTVLVAFAQTSAQAGEPAYPGVTEFTFQGERWPSQAPLATLCPAGGPCVTSSLYPFGANSVPTQSQLHRNGSVVRGSIHAQDAFGTARFHVMELELHTNDFFLRNPNAHIVFAPRTFLPYELPDGSSFHNYPFFNDWVDAPGVKRPAAYGAGLIIGNVPCAQNTPVPSGYLQGSRTNGIAIEHFLGIGAEGTENKVACPPAQLSFDGHSIYALKVAVKHDRCNPGSTKECRWVGYSITKLSGPAWGASSPAVGGGEDVFRDDSAPNGGAAWGPGPTPRGWSALRYADRSDWLISHIFTSANVTTPSAPWSFQVRNLQVFASASAPGWWPGVP